MGLYNNYYRNGLNIKIRGIYYNIMIVYKFLFIVNSLFSSALVNNNVRLYRNKNVIMRRNKYTPLMSFNNTSNNDLNEPDIIEKYSNWFGWFPPEKKWKSVRFTVYSILAGYMLGEGIQNLIDYSNSPNLDF